MTQLLTREVERAPGVEIAVVGVGSRALALPRRRRNLVRPVAGLLALLALVGIALLLLSPGSSPRTQAGHRAAAAGAPQVSAGVLGQHGVARPSAAPNHSKARGQATVTSRHHHRVHRTRTSVSNSRVKSHAAAVTPAATTATTTTPPVSPTRSTPSATAASANTSRTGGVGLTTPSSQSSTAASLVSPYTLHRPDIAFDSAALNRRQEFSNAARFESFPSAHHPAVTFLGLAGDGRTAKLLVHGRAAATGTGHCRPSPGQCIVLSLVPGNHETLTFQHNDGTTRQDGIDYRSVKAVKVQASQPPVPPVSAAGQRLMGVVAYYAPEFGSLRYSPSGLLRSHLRVPRAVIDH